MRLTFTKRYGAEAAGTGFWPDAGLILGVVLFVLFGLFGALLGLLTDLVIWGLEAIGLKRPPAQQSPEAQGG